MHTEEEAKQWVADIRPELIDGLQKCEEAPAFLKAPGNRFEEVWCAGCWMNEKLREAGATEKEVYEIGFSHGQRSLFGNPYKWAVSYINEFEVSKQVKDKPGERLADEICETHMQVGNNFVAFAIEDAI